MEEQAGLEVGLTLGQVGGFEAFLAKKGDLTGVKLDPFLGGLETY